MLNCGLGVILGRERCPHDLERSSLGHLLPASISPPPLLRCFVWFFFFVLPALPAPITSWGRWGGAGCHSSAPRGRPRPPVTQGARGGAAWGGPRRQGGRACRWRRRPGGSQTCLTTGRQGPASSGPAAGSPAWTLAFWTLWVETAAWTVGRVPSISRPSGCTAISNWPVTLAGPCSAGTRGLPEGTRRRKWAVNNHLSRL